MGRQKKVLIVDDNKLNIKVARKALEGFDLILAIQKFCMANILSKCRCRAICIAKC